MIGVVSKSDQKAAVDEFFELFKVHWEHYRQGRAYDVLLITDPTAVIESGAKVTIIYTAGAAQEDDGSEARVLSGADPVLLRHGQYTFPVYRGCRIFPRSEDALVQVNDSGATAGYVAARTDQHRIRAGYDLFDEARHLLSQGQTARYASLPTLDIHIAMLRSWILQSGVRLVEIPPVPYGYGFITCLTHDVDFIRIRDHGLGRSLLGFIARALIPLHLRDVRSKIAWSRLLRNWKALLALPGVYLGLSRDTWFDMDRYLKIEKGKGSTFFFIPFKNDPGYTDKGHAPALRAAHYAIEEQRDLINELIRHGCEIGLHGIDAWRDPKRGRRELEIIRTMIGESPVGLRMHWLFFSENSARTLDEAGYDYDSTVGFNEAIGFRSGTTQAYRLPGTRDLLELPLNLMDTTLFYAGRMGLSESKALKHCERLVSDFRAHGGVLTVNWHTRSLNPERNWDDFYTELLGMLQKDSVWFATARQAVTWFRKRRAVRIEDVGVADTNSTRVTLSSDHHDNSSHPVTIRIHHPKGQPEKVAPERTYQDIPWNGESVVVFNN